MIKNELSTLGYTHLGIDEVARMVGYTDAQSLCIAMGKADLLITPFANSLLRGIWEKEDLDSRAHEYRVEIQTKQAVFSNDGDVFVIEHAGNRELALCEVCNPRPGDPILGSILPQDKIKIHVNGCRLLTPDSMRGGNTIKLRWGTEAEREARAITLQVYAHDREGLLNDVTNLFRDDEININFLWSKTENFRALIIFSADVSETGEVIRFLHRALDLKNVINASYMGQTKSEHIIPENFFDGNPECDLKVLEESYQGVIGK